MRHRTIASQIAVPTVIRRIQMAFTHARVKHIKSLLALTATNNFTNTRRQHIHGRNGFVVVIQSHIKSLDALWIIHHHHWASNQLLGEIALMLALHINAPRHWIFKFLSVGNRGLKSLDGLGVIHALKRTFHKRLQPLHASFVHPFRHKSHVIRALIQRGGKDGFQ